LKKKKNDMHRARDSRGRFLASQLLYKKKLKKFKEGKIDNFSKYALLLHHLEDQKRELLV